MQVAENTKPLAPILKKLEVGESTDYPMRQYVSCNAVCQQLKKTFQMRFSQKTIAEDTFRVTRIA